MPASGPQVGTVPRNADPARHHRSKRARPRHDEAVIQAEVRRLARALVPFRVVHGHAPARGAAGQSWQRGGLGDAVCRDAQGHGLGAGVRQLRHLDANCATPRSAVAGAESVRDGLRP
jgi:hypothetical protein